jgi:hypothetical protein
MRVLHHTAAYQIGKQVNSRAIDAGQAICGAACASGKGGWIEDSAWKF